MGSESDINQQQEKCNLVGDSTARNTAITDDTPPVYYDSEPSSQPPRYPNPQPSQTKPTAESQTTAPTTPAKPVNQHRNSAPASTIAAVLASPYDDLDAQRRAERKNKTLRQR